MNRDVARVLEQMKTCLRYGGERFLYALNTVTALLNISFSLSGSNPKYRSFVSVVKEESDISSAALRERGGGEGDSDWSRKKKEKKEKNDTVVGKVQYKMLMICTRRCTCIYICNEFHLRLPEVHPMLPPILLRIRRKKAPTRPLPSCPSILLSPNRRLGLSHAINLEGRGWGGKRSRKKILVASTPVSSVINQSINQSFNRYGVLSAVGREHRASI